MDFYIHPDFVEGAMCAYLGHYLKHLIMINQIWKGFVSMGGLHDKEFDSTEVRRVLFEELQLAKPSETTTESPCLLVEWPDTKEVVLSSRAKANL